MSAKRERFTNAIDELKKRHHVAADKEIQRFAGEVLRHLRGIAPNSVQDIPDKPYGLEK